MHITNRTGFAVDYAIRNAETGVRLSKGWLEAGDADDWSLPAHFGVDRVRIDFEDRSDICWTTLVGMSDDVALVASGDGIKVRVK